MRRSLLKRPSPGLIVGLVALFVALGGGAYAATSDNKTDKKIAKKAAKAYFNANIGGASVSHATTANSATSATNATNATNAGNANTVGGDSLKTFSVIVPTGTTTPQTVVNFGGLTLDLACDAAGHPTLRATGSVTGSLIRGTKVTSAGATNFGNSNSTAGTAVTVIVPGDLLGNATFQYAQPDHHVVSVNVFVDDHNTIGGQDACSASGSAISG
jgi:hypothetical protein